MPRGTAHEASVPSCSRRRSQCSAVAWCSGATFLDSSILGALLEARRQALEAGLGYVVCLGDQPEAGVARILEITGLVPVFPVVRSLQEALSAARSAPADA